MRRSRRRLNVAARSLATGMALVAVLGLRTASSDPGDIFTQGAPLITDTPPQATPTLSGDASVSPTGSLEYNYPIAVPPGRQGMQPHLGLHYSSQAPIYGGIAAGWSLDIPTITLDTTKGRLWGTVTQPPLKNYRVSIGQQQLVVTSELPSDGSAAYRGVHDASFTRYERVQPNSSLLYKWRAYTTDGETLFFGDTNHVSCTSDGAPMVSDEYAPLTSQVDPFGNVVEYFYGQGVDGECRINSITWGRTREPGSATASRASRSSTTPRRRPVQRTRSRLARSRATEPERRLSPARASSIRS